MSDLLINSSFWIPLSILAASFVGSPHCLAMCGAITLNFAKDRHFLYCYHLGRLISYAGLGALAGVIGEKALSFQKLIWVPYLTTTLIALIMIYCGLKVLLGKTLHLRQPPFLQKLHLRAWSGLNALKLPFLSSAFAGALSAFLPCGHLYSFLAGSLAAGSALRGATFMFAFWLGTLPALAFGIRWLRALLNPGLSRGPRWAGALLIFAGLLSLAAFAARIETPRDVDDQVQMAKSVRCH